MRRTVRGAGAVGTAVALALLAGGCGDDKGDGDGKKDARPSAEKTTGEAGLPGVWSAQPAGEDLTLVVVGDSTLIRWEKGADGLCEGEVVHNGGSQDLMFQCANTPEERVKGRVEVVEDRGMRVNWDGSGNTSFTRVAKAPAELPKSPEELPGLQDKLKRLPTGAQPDPEQ